MYAERFMSSRKNQPQRDESYWAALLNQVESLPVAQLEQDAHQNVPPSVNTAPSINAQIADAWQEAQYLNEHEETVELRARGFNKGGLLVEWRGISGFVPASQLNQFPHVHLDSERAHELRKRQNQTMKLRVIEVDPTKNRLIFSERAALVTADRRRDLWEEIRVGDKRPGVVTNMAQFGAFVDLGGVEGLIHISEISWSRLSHPSDVVRPGQRIHCVVLEIDRQRGRVALSLKRMRPDPWIGVSERYKPGQIIEGVVNNIAQYGAFITLEDELEGLVHVSELAEGDFMHPRNVVDMGQWVRARVLTVNPRERRIALTMRGL